MQSASTSGALACNSDVHDSHYQEAPALDPRLTVARNNLGSVLLQTGDLGGAIRQYRLALADDPASPTANFNIALALNRQAKRQEAEPFLHRAAESADAQVRKAALDLLGARK
jgi:Flp pilus assembly protein TadD